MDELQTEVARVQGETTEQVEELKRKYCGKLTEHHEWLTDLEIMNESTVQEIKAKKLNVGRLEESLDGTEQNMQNQIQSGMAGFFKIFGPLCTQGLNGWNVTRRRHNWNKYWNNEFHELRHNSLCRSK